MRRRAVQTPLAPRAPPCYRTWWAACGLSRFGRPAPGAVVASGRDVVVSVDGPLEAEAGQGLVEGPLGRGEIFDGDLRIEHIGSTAIPGTAAEPGAAGRQRSGRRPRDAGAQRVSRSRIAAVISSGASSAMKCPAPVSRWSRSGAHACQTPAAS